jgi:Ca2+-transporting ATPase
MTSVSNGDAEVETCAECPLEHLYTNLGTSQEGLTAADAAKRLEKHGLNVLPEKKKLLSQSILIQFRNLFNVLLILASILSFISGITSNDIGSINMGIVILAVVLVSVLFALFQERRAERAVEAIRELVPSNAKVLRDGQVKQVPVSEIVPGDMILLEEGDKVPADARVVTGYEFLVDNSSLTGESEPQPRSPSCDMNASRKELVTCTNLIFAGTTAATGSATAVVVATGSDTQFGRVLALTHEIKEPASPLQIELNRTAKLNFVVAIAVGIIFLLIALLGLHLQFSESLLFMIGVMVSLVPEGFQVTVTLSLALSSLAMSKQNVIVKRLSSVETLGSTTVICTDKTGTITEGQMTVREIWIGGRTYNVTGEGYEPEGSVLLQGQKLTASDRNDLRTLCEIAALDNTSVLVPPLDRRKSRWTAIGDSTDAALLVLAAKAGIQHKRALTRQPRIGMIPFESRRKMMTSVHTNEDGGVTAYVKGAGLEILSRCTEAYWGESVVPMTEEIKRQIQSQIDAFAREAYRVLALATRKLREVPHKYDSETIETKLTFVGLVAILDPPRIETPEAVVKARNAGIKVIMLTGDHELTAEAIARKTGIITSPEGIVITGYALAQTTDEELSKILDRAEIVFARITPDQKLRIVRLLRQKGETVAVTGDGVNDAPALLEADIGIAMGIAGTDVARESADMVLLDDNFASIVNGVEEGRGVFDNLRKFIVYVFGHNWAELVTFIAFVLLQTPLPLAVVGVLVIDLIMEIPPSLSLTLEPPEPGIMDRLPRPRASRLFSLGALARSMYVGIPIGIAALFWCFQAWSQAGWNLGMSSIPDHAAYLKGTTIVVVGIMAGQLGSLFAMRTSVSSAFSLSLRRNKWLLAAVAVEMVILLAVVYAPPLQALFSTASIAPIDWLYLYSIAPAILLLEEGRKLVLRTVILPSKPVVAPRVMPLSAQTVSIGTAESDMRSRVPFIEPVAPVVLPLLIRSWEEKALPISLYLGKHRGSRIIIFRILDDRTEESALRRLESQVEKYAEDIDISYEYADLRLSSRVPGTQQIVNSLRDILRGSNSNTIVFPVDRKVFLGKRRAIGETRWIEEFSEKQVVLVSGPAELGPGSRLRYPRILIPVLREVHTGPFEMAEALTSNAVFPDVDVVVAKVVEIPRIVPLYSVYKPESLIDADKQLSFLKSLRGGVFLGRIRPMVLLVREASRDLLHFAKERKVDLIIMEGDWAARRHGFLAKEERGIASRADCTVLVTLPCTQLSRH